MANTVELSALPVTFSVSTHLSPASYTEFSLIMNGGKPLHSTHLVCLALNLQCRIKREGCLSHLPLLEHKNQGHPADLIFIDEEWGSRSTSTWDRMNWADRLKLCSVGRFACTYLTCSTDKEKASRFDQMKRSCRSVSEFFSSKPQRCPMIVVTAGAPHRMLPQNPILQLQVSETSWSLARISQSRRLTLCSHTHRSSIMLLNLKCINILARSRRCHLTLSPTIHSVRLHLYV